jgi:CDP-diacylglycerol--glycerol-3-phosphate 3-phosphatidyltransferase
MKNLLEAFRAPTYRVIDPAVRWMVRHRIHPNAVTTLGFLSVVAAGVLYHLDHVRWAGALVLFGGVWDIFDGQLARVSGMASKFGAFYDSTLDRISEIVVFLGLLSLYNRYGGALGDIWMVYALFLAMGGSLMVSYTRARAEGLGLDCKVGLMQRPTRVLLLGFGSVSFGLMWGGLVLNTVIVLVAVLTNVTTVQRILWVQRRASGVPVDDPSLRGQ